MFAQGAPITIPPMVSIRTKGIGWVAEELSGAAPASAAFEVANRAIYVPIILPSSCVVKRVWWANGATVAGGATVECGIYSDSGSYSPGTKLVSGSATQGTASEVQFVDVTDTALAPGLYWIALAASSSTNTTFFLSTVSAVVDAVARFNQGSAVPLPATATPVEPEVQNLYLCGFSTTASP